jgi:hypothetical protein
VSFGESFLGGALKFLTLNPSHSYSVRIPLLLDYCSFYSSSSLLFELGDEFFDFFYYSLLGEFGEESFCFFCYSLLLCAVEPSFSENINFGEIPAGVRVSSISEESSEKAAAVSSVLTSFMMRGRGIFTFLKDDMFF